MSDSTITRARSIVASLRDEAMAASERAEQMSSADVRAKLIDFGQALTIAGDLLREAEDEAEAMKEYS